MEKIIYTCVVNHYDIVFPPIFPSSDIRYVVVTDTTDLQTPGWEKIIVDVSQFLDFSSVNRYYKFFPNKLFGDFACTIYVDGNIRVIGPHGPLFDDFLYSGCSIGLCKHPHRSSVAEEILACIELGKVSESERLNNQYKRYLASGFQDDLGLTENNMIIRNYKKKNLSHAMELWWDLLGDGCGRDQVSLPFVRWKTGIDVKIYPWCVRDTNKPFGLYSHLKGNKNRIYDVYFSAKRFDNKFWLFLYKLYCKFVNLKFRIRTKLY